MAKRKRSFTPLDSKHLTGFTLVEVLVTIIIVAIVSMGSYFAFSALSISTQRSRDQLQVVSFIQLASEEVRTIARDNFDNLEGQFSAGFVEVDPKYPAFQRRIRITQKGGSQELKKADITIRWQDRGRMMYSNSALMLSRPPEPLPANIHGKVIDGEDGFGLDDATVTIIYIANPGIKFVTFSDSNGEYTFLDSDDNFRLNTGDWSLTATCCAYVDSEVILVNDLTSREDRQVNIYLEPQPIPATIKARLIKKDSHDLLRIAGDVDLWEDGEHYQDGDFSNGIDEFTIPFDDNQTQCFTLTTGDYDFSDYPVTRRYCGDFCDAHGWGKSYNYRGWSSAVAQLAGNAVCSNSWFGSSDTDRICVDPGDELTVDIPLVDVPLAQVNGYVYDSEGAPIKNAAVYTRWHTWSIWDPYPATHTDNNGYYEVSIPAEQELFPNSKSYYLLMSAGKSMPRMRCCDIEGTGWMLAGWHRVGPLHQGGARNQDFTINYPSAEECGNAKGYVKNGDSGSSLSGVRVRIDNSSSWQEHTDGSGYYIIQCPPERSEFCKVRTGRRQVWAKKRGYYEFRSKGNYWYSNRGYLNIRKNQTRQFETIRLWPMGYGIMKGRVVIAGTTTPISGVTVKLDKYWSSDMSTTTDGQGRFKFSNVIETWPASGVERNDYYKQTKRRHSVYVSYTDDYEPVEEFNIPLRDGQTKDLGDIGLVLKGQM